jgi:superfamily I DNA/RNA helicase
VDEYQDLNFGQYRIIRALAPPDGNIFVIGDPDQSIYGFRGSDVSYFQRFVDDFPSAVQYRLTQNYRSAETILEASHQVIRRHSLSSPAARVYSGIEGLEAIHILETETEKSETVAVGKTIEQMVGGTGFHFNDFGKKKGAHREAYRPFSDFAVLYRTHAQGDIFADTFTKAGIPFQRANKNHIFRRKNVMTLIALFKWMEGCGTYPDLEFILPAFGKTIARKDLNTLKRWSMQQNQTPGRCIAEPTCDSLAEISNSGKQALEETIERMRSFASDSAGWRVDKKLLFLAGHINRLDVSGKHPDDRDAFEYVLSIARPFEEHSAGFLELAALLSDHDIYDARSQKVALMTFHAAKGLEFPVVFIAGCENGLIPLVRKHEDACDVDEERRLFYVAMTRAKEELILTHAKKRRFFGKSEPRKISPFATDIEYRLIKQEISGARSAKSRQVQLKLFS